MIIATALTTRYPATSHQTTPQPCRCREVQTIAPTTAAQLNATSAVDGVAHRPGSAQLSGPPTRPGSSPSSQPPPMRVDGLRDGSRRSRRADRG